VPVELLLFAYPMELPKPGEGEPARDEPARGEPAAREAGDAPEPDTGPR
jgi:hypothetical protein